MTRELAQVETPIGAFRAVVIDGSIRLRHSSVPRHAGCDASLEWCARHAGGVLRGRHRCARRDPGRAGGHGVQAARVEGSSAGFARARPSATESSRHGWARPAPRARSVRPTRRIRSASSSRATGSIRAGGDIGNYGFGLDRKRWLLDHEATAQRAVRGRNVRDQHAGRRQRLLARELVVFGLDRAAATVDRTCAPRLRVVTAELDLDPIRPRLALVDRESGVRRRADEREHAALDVDRDRSAVTVEVRMPSGMPASVVEVSSGVSRSSRWLVLRRHRDRRSRRDRPDPHRCRHRAPVVGARPLLSSSPSYTAVAASARSLPSSDRAGGDGPPRCSASIHRAPRRRRRPSPSTPAAVTATATIALRDLSRVNDACCGSSEGSASVRLPVRHVSHPEEVWAIDQFSLISGSSCPSCTRTRIRDSRCPVREANLDVGRRVRVHLGRVARGRACTTRV